MEKSSKGLGLVMLLCAGLVSTAAQAYDRELAQSYQQLFAGVKGPSAGQALGLMSPGAFISAAKAGKAMVALDIRTEAEMSVYGLTLPGALSIAADQVFEPDNLAKLPRDKLVVLVCKSGARATAVGTALRHAGFDNVLILKGGFKGLSAFLGPKEAH